MEELKSSDYGEFFQELGLCHPIRTKNLRRDILESVDEVEEIYKEVDGFFQKKENFFGFEICGDTPIKILEDILKPFRQGNAFGQKENYFKIVSSRLNNYFNALHHGTIDSFVGKGRDGENGDEYDKLFNIFRFKIMTEVEMLCGAMLIWYERTEKWKKRYSRFTEIDEKYRSNYQRVMDNLEIGPGMRHLFDK